ncbi:protein TRANSPARENT TESTA 9-like isoform X1 [Mangifera indica]|uniref:protein TRANSPARENT TESTA 9-like isoform X1 n=1 Tax=Mangifera indica TaxID=29780 RepID=UPI001CFAA05D|nr:protein TRANSPARENT TESTA 9-like isoform X1 [Mangifera indica]XP_044481107.1 protein TRANSPARENT TESTA 9-like isoform X1 [Mangifera indica]XP_044481108.1 protein TRANSPARENT TESTA 9-like isoform X1 [Mangifera indica]XP_044481109.1 protein TRANSPARENT TESTA 9-like isoform X1 [Mangifera indica]
MWRSVWRSIDRFSLQHFKYVINELRQIKAVDWHNREVVIDLLQSIVEIVTYGDRQDPMIFECFMEYQVLAEFVRVLKISRNSRIEAPLLQYLSIMIQNMGSEHAIYYCLSNDYINNIIEHTYEFEAGDLAPYYMSFLRAVSNKINRDTLCLLVKVDSDAVTSFPLYTEALKFAQHGEKMIQTAVRALTLNIFNVSDDMVYQFVTTPPASKYFSDLVHSLRKKCIHLDGLVKAAQETYTDQKKRDILLESDKIVDDMYYFKDILSISESHLSKAVTKDLLNILVFPLLLPSLQLRQSNEFHVSAATSLYIVSQLLQVVGGKNMINSVAALLLFPYMALRIRDAIEGDTIDGTDACSFYNLLHELEIAKFFSLKSKGEEDMNGNHLSAHEEAITSSNPDSDRITMDGDTCVERCRKGILAYINSENHILLFASVFLLLILAENKDLDSLMSSAIGLSEMQDTMRYDISASEVGKNNILRRLMPQVLNALLKVLASQPPFCALIQWHAGWFLRKLLLFQGNILNDHYLQLFDTSYLRSCERLQKELDGCWFDQILETLKDEWANCKSALQEALQSKDPLFLLELAVCQQTIDGSRTSSIFSWETMVDAVKVFTFHVQLKTFIVKGNLPENPFLDLMSGPATDSEISQSLDLSSASFGSEVFLGSGFPCRIAFSNAGVRDIYLIPVARGISGKLILAEKHPFRSQRGVVIAIAPLAGLSPKIDEDHPMWLHLRVREFVPRSNASKTRGFNAKKSDTGVDGRWTLGFTSNKACEAARMLILEETRKQRSQIESILSPFLQNDYLENLFDNQAG